MSDYEIRDADASVVQPLRHALLRIDAVIGDTDPAAAHTGAFRDDQLVGCASIHPEPMPQGPSVATWRIHGVAVDHGHRGLGIGGKLLEKSLEHAARTDDATVWGVVPAGAFGFFERHGFSRSGDPMVGADGPEYLVHTTIRPLHRSWKIDDARR